MPLTRSSLISYFYEYDEKFYLQLEIYLTTAIKINESRLKLSRLRLLNTLKLLADSGRTVVTTIHQPSSKMYQIFDRLILLAEGHVLYYGAAKDAMEYFARLGYSPKYSVNPADYLLDLATGEPKGVR
jgi:hypothetical protein